MTDVSVVAGFVDVMEVPCVNVNKIQVCLADRHDTSRCLRRTTIVTFRDPVASRFACLVLDSVLFKVWVIEVLLQRARKRNRGL